ncbi:MAG: hypothetical protein H7239_15575 [Flavobacterium sp.]|nr:hypothetical protein [Flavobacterium sp.]
MDEQKQLQYYVKIMAALNTVFDEDGENYIDVFDDDFSGNDFFHVLATRVPQMIMAKLTSQEFGPLEFNHVCNKLIMQDRIDNQKIKAK